MNATCNITPGCERPAVDHARFVNPNMDWHGDALGQGDACREHMLALVDPLHRDAA